MTPPNRPFDPADGIDVIRWALTNGLITTSHSDAGVDYKLRSCGESMRRLLTLIGDNAALPLVDATPPPEPPQPAEALVYRELRAGDRVRFHSGRQVGTVTRINPSKMKHVRDRYFVHWDGDGAVETAYSELHLVRLEPPA